MTDLTTYENMDVLAHALPDESIRRVLVNLWRRTNMGLATHEHRARVRRALPELWRPVLAVTMPHEGLLKRWERDHGYQSR